MCNKILAQWFFGYLEETIFRMMTSFQLWRTLTSRKIWREKLRLLPWGGGGNWRGRIVIGLLDTEWRYQNETETFFRDQIFWNRNRYFFSETKFSETETVTFFRDQNFQNQNWDFFPRPNSPKAIPKPSKNWQKLRDCVQIFSSFSFSVFLLLQKKRYLLFRIFSSSFFSVFLLIRNRTST